MREVAIRFRRRHDVYAIVAEELDEVLAKSKPASDTKEEKTAPDARSLAKPQIPFPTQKTETLPLEKLHGRTYVALAQTYSDVQLMATLGIVFDGKRYQYLNYSFAVLPVAVDYAIKRVSPKPQDGTDRRAQG